MAPPVFIGISDEFDEFENIPLQEFPQEQHSRSSNATQEQLDLGDYDDSCLDHVESYSDDLYPGECSTTALATGTDDTPRKIGKKQKTWQKQSQENDENISPQRVFKQRDDAPLRCRKFDGMTDYKFWGTKHKHGARRRLRKVIAIEEDTDIFVLVWREWVELLWPFFITYILCPVLTMLVCWGIAYLGALMTTRLTAGGRMPKDIAAS